MRNNHPNRFWNRPAFLLGLATLLASCAREPDPETRSLHFQLESPYEQVFTLANPGPEAARFSLQLNQSFYLNRYQIARQIRAKYSTPLEQAQAAWQLVLGHTHALLFSDERWLHAPELLLNSIGYGWCDDQAAALCQIWETIGLESRIWHLEGHVVLEVKVNGEWQMYDPNLGIYYLGKKGNILSAEAIANQEAYLVSNGKAQIRLDTGSFRALHLDKFLSREDNQLNTWFLEEVPLPDTFFTLPPNSTMSCCTFSPREPANLLLKISLPPGFRGTIHAPLVFAFAESPAPSLAQKLDSTHAKAQVKPIEIDAPLKDSCHLFFLVNPSIPMLSDSNNLILNGLFISQLRLSFSPDTGQANRPRRSEPGMEQLFENAIPIFSVWPQLPEIRKPGDIVDAFAVLQQANPMPLPLAARQQEQFRLRYDALLRFLKNHPEYENPFLQSLQQPDILGHTLRYYLLEFPPVLIPALMEQQLSGHLNRQKE